MANEAEVSSAIGEISASIEGEASFSSIIIEIASIIPDGEAAVASCAVEVAFSFEEIAVAGGVLQGEIIRRQISLQSHSLRNRTGQKSNL